MYIQDPQVQNMVQQLAELTGQSLTDAIKTVVAQALDQAQANQVLHQPRPLVDRLNEIALHCAALPDYDQRSADEILGYDNDGLPS
jgi:antitoxin VapB